MKIAVLNGGDSSEREVSLRSGLCCAKALRALGHESTLIDTADHSYPELLASGGYDVAFMALHGGAGESGFAQAVCEELMLPYTHSGVKASAIAMDKALSKFCYRNANVSTPTYCCIKAPETTPTFEAACKTLDSKTIVAKPTCGGSSVGVFIISNTDEWAHAMTELRESNQDVIVEQYIDGIEVTVPFMRTTDGSVYRFPVVEAVPAQGFYDYTAKYSPGGCKHVCPARISPAETEECMRLAEASYDAIGCSGLARTDMLVDGNGKVWVLETNTIPGMRPDSLAAHAAEYIDMNFEELIEAMLKDAHLKGYQ